MGQRHQCFIHVANPVKKFYDQLGLRDKAAWNGRLKEYIEHTLRKKAQVKSYGLKETTVLAYHHQWLYGRSALLAALNVLEFSKNADKDSNPMLDNSHAYNSTTISDVASFVTSLLGIFNGPLAQYARCGYERFLLFNEYECEYMREDFTRGDNNDGIFIVDAIAGKYCFMDVHKRHDDIEPMVPLSAKEYVESYYPTRINDDLKYQTERYKTTAEEQIKENSRINSKFLKRFEKFEVLTADEIVKIFPKMKGKVKESLNKEVQVV
jgi:hypothetical protein